MKVSVAYIRNEYQFWQSLDLSEPCTLLRAIEQSRVLELFSQINLQTQKVGVFGQIMPLDALLTDGDRVEIYSPLIWQAPQDDDDD